MRVHRIALEIRPRVALARLHYNAMASLWSTVRRFEFFLVSLVFHLIFTWSIFDVYFRSPVVHPGPRFNATHALQAAPWTEPPPSDRLVLIVADGLRADTLFQRHSSQALPEWAKMSVHGNSSEYAGRYPAAFTRTTATPTEPPEDQPGYAYAAPFLRSIAKGPGIFGVSHTRVPTESRPGHVALIAGMYEDISAVTKGWKVNPLAFDSLLNQSTRAYAYGSPDIVPMFVLGTSPDKVEWEVYEEDAEDFTKDAIELDVWVLNRMKALLSRGRHDSQVGAQLRQSGNVFFLHLLGLDTTGHTYRPMSPEYIGNTIVVDAIVEQVHALFREYFQDDRTTFVLTADHGMSRKGNHGDGDPDNTRTPLVAWGAGVPHAQILSRRRFVASPYDQHWGLDHFARTDVEQADLTPLMASWLGISVPANAEGRLPLDLLAAPEAYKARAALATAQQVLEVYRVKHTDRAERMLFFEPYPALRDASGIPGAAQLRDIQALILNGQFDEAIEDSEALANDALYGAKYLHQYDAPILRVIIVLGYVGLFLLGVVQLLHLQDDAPNQAVAQSPTLALMALTVGLLAMVWGKFALDHSPGMYFVYSGATGAVWILLSLRSSVLVRFLSQQFSLSDRIWTVAYLTLALLVLEVAVYGYLRRLTWAAIVLFMAFFPMLASPMSFKDSHQIALLVWILTCVGAAWFMSLPTEKNENLTILWIGGLLLWLVGLMLYAMPETFFLPPDYLGRDKRTYAMMHAPTLAELERMSALPNDKEEDVDLFWPRTRAALLIQLLFLGVSIVVTVSSANSLAAKQGLPRLNQIVGWGVLVCSTTVPFLLGFQRPRNKVAQPARERLILFVYAFAPVFVILSLGDEVLFYLCYALMALTWGHCEAELARERSIHSRERQSKHMLTPPVPPPRGLILDDVRLGLVYFLLLHVGFFGTGNVASISSFYLSPVYRLVPVFQPFLMASLLLLKLIVPFVLLSCVLAAVCMQPVEPRAMAPVSTRIPIVASGLGLRDIYIPLIIAGLAGDVLALNFFFAIRDEGSWLEIGQSITHFVMANLLQVYMLAIATLSAWIMGIRANARPAATASVATAASAVSAGCDAST